MCIVFLVSLKMGRPRSVRSSMFTVPRVSKQIDDRSRIPKEITSDPFYRAEKKAKNPFELPTVELGKSRTGLLKRLLERGRITKSESSFAHLQQRKFFPTLVHSEVDCLDEAELRSRFPKQGVNHKFFNSGDAKFHFILPKESDQVVVAQIHWDPKIRM